MPDLLKNWLGLIGLGKGPELLDWFALAALFAALAQAVNWLLTFEEARKALLFGAIGIIGTFMLAVLIKGGLIVLYTPIPW